MCPNQILSKLTIAIVGSPNVGKSTFFNRLIKKRKAVVESSWGVTRNRLFADFSICGINAELVDTGGIKTYLEGKIDQLVYDQVKATIGQADIILFVCDGKIGITPLDENVTSLLRKSSKKVFLVVNKIDNKKREDSVCDFYELGMDKPYPISALSGYGINVLLKDLGEYVSTIKNEFLVEIPPKKEKIIVAIVGRPNVGKSSFINSLFKQDIVIVSEIAGTTRDSIDMHFEYKDKIFILVDTAGIKHKRKLRKTVEIFSIARSKASIRKAEVSLVMLNAEEGLCVDDIKIIEYVAKNYKPCAILVNKWDLIKETDEKDYERALKMRLKTIKWMPVIFISCLQGKNLFNALNTALLLKEKANTKIRTTKLNKLLEEIQAKQSHPIVAKKRIHIYYGTQTRILPQVITLFCNYPRMLRPDYLNFIENNIRKHFGLLGVPIELKVRETRKD